MSITRRNAEAPVRVPLVDAARVVTLRWLQWFQEVGNAVQAVVLLDTPYDPPNIGAGATLTVNVTVPGVSAKDIVRGVSLSPMAVGGVANSSIRIAGNCVAADTVAVTFTNVSGGAINLDAGTLRVSVERLP